MRYRLDNVSPWGVAGCIDTAGILAHQRRLEQVRGNLAGRQAARRGPVAR